MNTAWDLSPLRSDYAKDRKSIKRSIEAFRDRWQADRSYLSDPKKLKAALDEYENIIREHSTGGKESYFLSLSHALKEDDPNILAQINNMSEFSTKLANEIEFFTLDLGQVPKAQQKRFLDSALLQDYNHYLETLFIEAEHHLSLAEEKIMNLKSKTSYSNWVMMTSKFIAAETGKVDGQVKSFSEILSLLNSKEKKIRDEAAVQANRIFSTHAGVAAEEMNSILEDKKVNDELRRFPRPDSARHISDDISSKAVDALIEAVSSNFDISARYYRLKSKLMGVERLEYHERNVPIGKIRSDYGFDEGTELVKKVFLELDPEFEKIFSEFLSKGRIDAFPKKGKSSGAFCSSGLLSHPTYVMLNFTGKLDDLTTIAHEMGHAINNELMRKERNGLDFGVPLCIAETASTFMEDFVVDKLSEGADGDLKLGLLMHKLNSDVSTIFRQIACYMFEQELHSTFRKKFFLPKEEIGRLFSKHMSAYMGDHVEQSPGSQNWWVYWSHIRHYFYNYSYAFGLLISKALQNRVRKDPNYIEEVKHFLEKGSKESPEKILKDMGIDITHKTFWEEGIGEIRKQLEELESTLAESS